MKKATCDTVDSIGSIPTDFQGSGAASSDLSDDELDTFRRICKNMKYTGPIGGDEAIEGMDIY